MRIEGGMRFVWEGEVALYTLWFVVMADGAQGRAADAQTLKLVVLELFWLCE